MVDMNGWVYIKICKGMYGLKKSWGIKKQKLVKHLKIYSHRPVTFTPDLWNHEDKDTVVSLVINDFAINYTLELNTLYLLQAIKDKYEIYMNWKAQLYIEISLKWDYIKRIVDLSMLNYVNKTLAKFNTF